jgi:hypothetical protein
MPGNDNGPSGERAAIDTNQHPAGISAAPSLPPAADITALCRAYVALRQSGGGR